MKRSANQILDEIALREASLADARREREAGELSALEAATIEARETIALAAAREELEAMRQSPQKGRPSRRRRRWLLFTGLVCILIAVVVVLWSSISPRQEGNSITGSVSLSRGQHITQLLTEAQNDLANNLVLSALSAYGDVLALSPRNVVALTETGWLDFSAGSSDQSPSLVALGIKELRRAIAAGPRNAAARLYYGIAAYSTPGNRAVAISEFKVFLDLHPSSVQLGLAHPYLVKLGLATS
jgi:cytochrome c-type biogenesis protein CcmH/NrfG